MLRLFFSIKQRVSSSFHTLQEHVLRWIKPSTIFFVLGTFADLTRGKAELLAENALLTSATDHSASTGQATDLSEDRSASFGAPSPHGPNLETGALPGSKRRRFSGGTVSFSVCSGSTNPRRTRESRSSRGASITLGKRDGRQQSALGSGTYARGTAQAEYSRE